MTHFHIQYRGTSLHKQAKTTKHTSSALEVCIKEGPKQSCITLSQAHSSGQHAIFQFHQASFLWNNPLPLSIASFKSPTGPVLLPLNTKQVTVLCMADLCACVCVCVCARARACMHACVCECVCFSVLIITIKF